MPEVEVPKTQAEEQKSALRILLVEDDDAVRGGMMRVLRRLGHEVQPCVGSEEAHAAPPDFDVAIVDMNLGRGRREGLEVVEQLRARSPTSCFVITSGDWTGFPPTSDHGPLQLRKPFSRKDLVSLLEEAQTYLLRQGHRLGE